MNRGYTRKEYLELINKIRENIDKPSISTDIIVGFPGETEDDFAETMSLVKELKFGMAYTFSYSPRSGTSAADLDNQIDEDLKKDRLQRLMDLQNRISYENNKALKNETIKVLVEGESKNNPDNFMGRSRRNKLVIFPKCQDCKGKIRKVKINEVNSWTLYGKLVEMG
jgi:tRNA-2-methylthio-N6-dimethylallyladenosine synthase